MLGIHAQPPVTNWPNALAQMTHGAPFKAVDNVQMLDEAKRLRPDIVTIHRHWADDMQVYDDWSYTVYLDRARQFFARHIDDTFREYAHAVDFVETYNETLANSQSPEETTWRVLQETAFCEVWATEYAAVYPELAHIRLCLANAAIGNDIPTGYAALAAEYGYALGYHSYSPFHYGEAVHDPIYYQNRYQAMDERFQIDGVDMSRVNWLITEAGPVGDETGGGALNAGSGWRDDVCLNGNEEAYMLALRDFAQDAHDWNQLNGNRLIGAVIFTSSNSPNQWDKFNTTPPLLDEIFQTLAYIPSGDVIDFTTPPPDNRIKRVLHLLPQNATIWEKEFVIRVAHAGKESMMQSADDALGLLNYTDIRPDSEIHIWNPHRWEDDIIAYFASDKWVIVERETD